MITGNKEMRVVSYIPIDHSGDEPAVVKPRSGETFVGSPWGYHAGDSAPFIEVFGANHELIRTVNALDCSEITFKKEETT